MAKTKVLVVDDDNLMRTLLKAIVKDEGFTVAGEAKDGMGALDACDRVAPDLVCLDINMPGMSGLETLVKMRERYPDVRVVMVTADSSMATVREAVSQGASGYIIKPFSAGRVGDTLRAALSAPASSDFG